MAASRAIFLVRAVAPHGQAARSGTFTTAAATATTTTTAAARAFLAISARSGGAFGSTGWIGRDLWCSHVLGWPRRLLLTTRLLLATARRFAASSFRFAACRRRPTLAIAATVAVSTVAAATFATRPVATVATATAARITILVTTAAALFAALAFTTDGLLAAFLGFHGGWLPITEQQCLE
jgi:hypothetical protein